MEISSRHHHHQESRGGGGGEKYPSSPMNSPKSNVTNSSSNSNNNNNNNNNNIQIQTPPLTPKNIITPRSDSSPYPTTFVQADTTTFKQVVQMLTGSTETPKTPSSSSQQQHHHHQQQQQQQDPLPPPSSRNFNIPPIKTGQNKKQQGFKLYERRNSLIKNSLMINTLMPNFASSQHQHISNNSFSPRSNNFNNNKPEILSPSLLDFPSLALSPVTPLNGDDPFDNKSSPSLGNSSEEEKAIAEKGFYLHPSPMTTPRETEPQLLPLFPLTSPRVSVSDSSQPS